MRNSPEYRREHDIEKTRYGGNAHKKPTLRMGYVRIEHEAGGRARRERDARGELSARGEPTTKG